MQRRYIVIDFRPVLGCIDASDSEIRLILSIFQNILNLHALFGRKEPNSRLEQRNYMKLDETCILLYYRKLNIVILQKKCILIHKREPRQRIEDRHAADPVQGLNAGLRALLHMMTQIDVRSPRVRSVALATGTPYSLFIGFFTHSRIFSFLLRRGTSVLWI